MAVNGREEFNAGVFENETIDIAHYLGIIKRYAFRIVSLAIAFTILVALLVMRMTPMFTSTTTILVEAEKLNYVTKSRPPPPEGGDSVCERHSAGCCRSTDRPNG